MKREELLAQLKDDYLVRALGFNGEVRALAIRSTKTVYEAQLRHQTTPVVTAALGRTLTIGAMMGTMQKGDTRVTLKVEGDGPIGKIIVDAETKKILGAAILGTGGDEAIHGILDMMNAGVAYDVLQWAVPIHPTVSELIPTVLGELKPSSVSH